MTRRRASTRRRVLKKGALLGATLPATAGLVSGATSTEIDSCTTITEPGRYYLTADIGPGSDDVCIDIQASNVTLEGQGHEIVGPDSPTGSEIGVRIHNPASRVGNVTVKNIVVSGWPDGIQLRDAERCRVADSTAIENGVGVFLSQAEARITSNDLLKNTDGIFLRDGSQAQIHRNTATSNTTGINLFDSTAEISRNVGKANTYAGIFLSACSNNRVTNNVVQDNGVGIFVTNGARNNDLVKNVASDNDGHGIFVEDVSLPNEPGTGANRIGNNRANGNGEDGISLRGGGDNRLVRNVAKENGDDGIELFDSSDNVLIANVACDNSDEQIVIGGDSTGNHLRANDTEC